MCHCVNRQLKDPTTVKCKLCIGELLLDTFADPPDEEDGLQVQCNLDLTTAVVLSKIVPKSRCC